MATTYTRTLNRRQLREKVARRCGVRAAGSSLAPADQAVINEAIDLRLKELHQRNTLWFSTAGTADTVALTAGDSTASLAALEGFLYPITVRLVVGTEDRPVDVVSHREYHEIETKEDTGEPEKAFFDGSTVHLWPVPDDDYDLKVTYQGIAADSSDAAAIDIEAGAMRAFANLVALDVADEFDVDENKVARWMQMSGEWMRAIYEVASERIDNTPVQPDYF